MTAKTKSKTTKPQPTKPETILKLISRPAGASLGALEKATGWQPHSVRAALTGLRKAGLAVERGKDAKGVTVYRVAKAAPVADAC
ncbi:DUF3489 domain-containing protein [bacterium SCSIO 12827]|nr:DUF3489 domain-containing protein [bacterium SCSIO 12827]